MKGPKVVEFMGLPNAGKTKLAEMTEREMKSLGYSVRFIPDQIRGVSLNDEIEKNCWAVMRTGSLIAEAKEQHRDLILAERGAWAIFASLNVWLKKSRTKKQKEKAESGLRVASDVALYEDFFILINISPKISLARDYGIRLGTIVNPVFLQALEQAYQKIQRDLPVRKRLVLNGEDSFQENQEKIVKALIRLIGPKPGNPRFSVSGLSKKTEAVYV